jgi:hypothetical protein
MAPYQPLCFHFDMLADAVRDKQNFRQTAEFNEGGFYPINLKPKEVNDPLEVFAAFVYDDWRHDQIAR